MELDLQRDEQALREYIHRRIAEFSDSENLGPGEPGDPIRLITLGYYAEQGGYAALILDTRADAEVDGEWTLHLEEEENILTFPDWCEWYEAACDGEACAVKLPDGSTKEVHFPDADPDEVIDEDSLEELNAVFGEVITRLMHELRDDGSLAKLPLAPDAFMVIEEFDGNYFWPTYETRKTEGRIPAG